MKFHLANTAGLNIFTAHGDGYVQVNQQRYSQPLIVTPDILFQDWSASRFATLTAEDFSQFLQFKPEVVILGSGSQHLFAHPQLFQALTAAGIGVECMSTPAACRTYNILTGEDRKVAVGILFE